MASNQAQMKEKALLMTLVTFWDLRDPRWPRNEFLKFWPNLGQLDVIQDVAVACRSSWLFLKFSISACFRIKPFQRPLKNAHVYPEIEAVSSVIQRRSE